MAATKLSPETEELAALILAGIDKARPNDPDRPKSVDAVVAFALGKLRKDVEGIFPEYFETKPARALRKNAA
jgi:hypothetical protein